METCITGKVDDLYDAVTIKHLYITETMKHLYVTETETIKTFIRHRNSDNGILPRGRNSLCALFRAWNIQRRRNCRFKEKIERASVIFRFWKAKFRVSGLASKKTRLTLRRAQNRAINLLCCWRELKRSFFAKKHTRKFSLFRVGKIIFENCRCLAKLHGRCFSRRGLFLYCF